MEAIIKSGISAILAYSIHYGTTKFYTTACVPDGILGYLSGLITTGSPVCQASLQVIANTQVSYSSLITMGITSVITEIISGSVIKNKAE
jgi:hypothetical protein